MSPPRAGNARPAAGAKVLLLGDPLLELCVSPSCHAVRLSKKILDDVKADAVFEAPPKAAEAEPTAGASAAVAASSARQRQWRGSCSSDQKRLSPSPGY